MGISIWQLLIILLIVVLLFGTKRLRSIGKDMGGAVKGFRDAMGDAEEKAGDKAGDKAGEDRQEQVEHRDSEDSSRVIEGEVDSESREKNKV